MQNQEDILIWKTLYEMIEIFRTVKLDNQESQAVLNYTKALYLKQNS